MYNSVKKSIRAITLASSVIILTACGGGGASETSGSGGGTVINKPNPSSMAASSITEQSSSEPKSSSAPQATVSSSSSINKSSSATSSETYVRASRSSSNSSLPSSGSGTDTTPPSGTKLLLYRLSESSITLLWEEATDNVGISHYEIERDGKILASIDPSIHVLSDQQLLAYTDYQYTITAFDAAGNKSEKSPPFKIRTLANANSSRSNSSTSSSSTSNSSISSGSAKSISSTSSSTTSQQSAKLTWAHPSQRENGQYLELDEIGGYEIRYRKATDKRFTYIVINSNQVTEYTHADASDTEFEIAVFDINGVYSRFVKVSQ
ncbi:fibronectin type III domain-containing protein [Cellvibrio sp. UBA7661]|uniref:fibronectin type III domain-containing protein n=1 Tax=Cellvibrio sp. UBA7661 TaxID=1946311 RepID=UPI002F35F534